MKLNELKGWLSEENIMKLIEQYQDFGLLPGFLLPLLEAFLPFLPLFVFVMANVNAFGLWVGFLISWSGTVVGAFIVFLIFRNYGQRKLLRYLQKYKQVQKLMDWVERHGFGPVFLLLCFPFTPSAVVNIVAGLSRISLTQYLLAVMTGKAVMVFMISFVGYDVTSLFKDPSRTAIAAGIIFVLWYVGKQMEARLNRKSVRERE